MGKRKKINFGKNILIILLIIFILLCDHIQLLQAASNISQTSIMNKKSSLALLHQQDEMEPTSETEKEIPGNYPDSLIGTGESDNAIEDEYGANKNKILLPENEPEGEENIIHNEETIIESEEPEGQLPPAMIDAIETDPSSIVVYTFAELKKALTENNTYTTVYIGANIAIEYGGIYVNTKKTNLTINGRPPTDPGMTYTLSDYSYEFGTVTHTIMIQANNTVLKVHNLNVKGTNYYGTFSSAASYTNVSFIYDNVTYSGPELTCNYQGTVRVKDSTIEISNKNNGAPPQELVESSRLEFEGDVNITHVSSAGYSVFWPLGTNQYLKVLDGANVSITTNNYLVFTDTNLLVVTIGKYATLNVSTSNGFTYDALRVESVFVDTGGALLVKAASTRIYPTIRINSLLQMEAGSTLQVIGACSGTSNALIEFVVTNSKILFNHPKRVILHNSSTGGLIRSYISSITTNLTINTNAINIWTASASLTDAITNMPDNIWNKADSSPISVTATLKPSTTAISSNLNVAIDPIINPLSTTTFKLDTSHLLVMGSHYLDIDPILISDRNITGATVLGSSLKASYTGTDGKQELAGSANSSLYSIPITGAAIPLGTKVDVISHINYLKIRQFKNVEADQGKLRFVSIPEELLFQTSVIAPIRQQIVREDPNWTISVSDDRTDKYDWSLSANVRSPLYGVADEKTYYLYDALLFADIDGTSRFFEEYVPITVYTETARSTLVDINWPADRGILLSVFPGEAMIGVDYHTSIYWTLTTAP